MQLGTDLRWPLLDASTLAGKVWVFIAEEQRTWGGFRCPSLVERRRSKKSCGWMLWLADFFRASWRSHIELWDSMQVREGCLTDSLDTVTGHVVNLNRSMARCETHYLGRAVIIRVIMVASMLNISRDASMESGSLDGFDVRQEAI